MMKNKNNKEFQERLKIVAKKIVEISKNESKQTTSKQENKEKDERT